MIDLVLLGVIVGGTLYGHKIRDMFSSERATLKVPQPGTNVSLQHEKNLSQQLRELPKYNLGVDDDPEVVDLYRRIDPTFHNYGMENVYEKLIRLKNEK